MSLPVDPLSFGSISPGDSRVTLAAALAWRAIAELARRHLDTHESRIVQFHPGASARGVIGIRMQSLHDRSRSCTANFHLGGPSGTYSIGDEHQPRRALAGLLSEHPEKAVDEVERLMKLPHRPGPVPPSSDRVLGLRLVAELLERRAFDRVPWRASLAAWDWSGGTSVSRWHSALIGDKYLSDRRASIVPEVHARLSDLVLVHCAPQDRIVDDLETMDGSAIAIDLDAGAINRLTSSATDLVGNCRSLYVKHNRSMREMVNGLDRLLDGHVD